MQSEEPVDVKSEDSLASRLGDPSGPPQAVEAKDPVLRAIAGIGITLVVAGGLLVPLASSVSPCMGATRSAKVQWEQRQQQVEQAEIAHQRQAHE
jgi:hypothetical protein